MVPIIKFTLVSTACLVSTTAASTDDQVNAAINYGTFLNPSSIVRPRFRYWLPDSSVDSNTVKEDIRSNAHIGAGGVEFLPYFGYGGQMNSEPAGADWAVSNFGTPQFLSIFEAALEAHKENGLKMDFAMGPNQGQGVPASTNDEGLQWDLVPYNQTVPANGAFDGIIPGWGTGDLVALVSAEVLSARQVSYQVTSLASSSNVTYDEYVLKHGTLMEQTHNVNSATGQLSLSFQPTNKGSSHRLFAFYQKLSLNKNLEFTVTEDTSVFDNGSYIVDHYSAKGAKTITDFWEKYILNDKIKDLLTEVGNYGWEDSVEITSNISWSRSLPDRFERLLGYDIRPILPLLTFAQNNIGVQSTAPGAFKCVLDTDDQGAGYINDFHAALQDGYREYLDTLVRWINTALGLQFSAQPSYNLPMDMLATVPNVNAPECESLGFSDNIDTYLQFSGPAQLAARRGFSGGVNQYVIHGQAFSGSYYGTTWPGYVPWGYIFSESWNNKEPVWEHGFADAVAYLSRTQQILQTGTPKVDIAFFWKQTATTLTQAYNTRELIKTGWTYSYISPDNFALPQAVVRNGVLGFDGPAWKVLVVDSTQNLSVVSVTTLSTYANARLPILVVGGSPGFYPTKDNSSKPVFQKKILALLSHKNVHRVSWDDLPETLTKLQISPRIETKTNGTLYTTWRKSKDDSIDYAFVYSDVVASSGKIVVQTKKQPYCFNAWTGERNPVLIYTQDESSTTIPLNLAANQSVILAFSDNLSTEITTPSFHITSSCPNVLGYKAKDHSSIVLNIGHSRKINTIRISTGKEITLSASDVPIPISLEKWTLVAEHWEAPANLSEQTIIASKINTTHKLNRLQSWLDIPELVNASGVGYYTTTFSWPPSRSKSAGNLGAYITISNVLNTARIYVNGQRLPASDVTHAVADISPYLVNGENEILVEVPTVMWNYLRSILDDLENAGSPPLLSELTAIGLSMPGKVDVGLIGDVIITPFKQVKIGK